MVWVIFWKYKTLETAGDETIAFYIFIWKVGFQKCLIMSGTAP